MGQQEHLLRDCGEFNVLRKVLEESSEVIINVTSLLRKQENNAPKSLLEVIINMTTEVVHWGLKS